jgi:hypothetical protein
VDHAVLRDILMIDAIPLSIGLEKADGGTTLAGVGPSATLAELL